MGLTYEEKKRMKGIQDAIRKRVILLSFCERQGKQSSKVAKKKKEEIGELRKELEKYRNKFIDGMQIR